MWALVLGSAAGGGFPQWNCWCANCAGVRAGTLDARPRAQAALAVSADRERCVLLDGTCWSDDELAAVGLGEKTARGMGHLPVSGPDGSLAAIADASATDPACALSPHHELVEQLISEASADAVPRLAPRRWR